MVTAICSLACMNSLWQKGKCCQYFSQYGALVPRQLSLMIVTLNVCRTTTHKSFKHMKSYQWWFVPRLPKPFPSVISNTIRETISGGILSVYYNHRIGGTFIQKPIFDRISEWNSPDLIKPDFDCCLHECHSKNVSDAPSINTSPCATSGSGDTSWDWDEASISNTRFRHIFIYLINILVIYHSQLKPERYHEVTDGTGGCRNDNLRCRQWRPSWHHDNSLLQGLSLWSLQCYWMSHRLYCQPYCALCYFFLATLSVEAPVAICLWWYRYRSKTVDDLFAPYWIDELMDN